MSSGLIPIPIERLPSHRGLVHVEGWNEACCFVYKGTDELGVHHLITPKSKRKYRTSNRLLYTRRNAPK